MCYWVDYIFGDCVFALNVNAKFLQDGVYAFFAFVATLKTMTENVFRTERENVYMVTVRESIRIGAHRCHSYLACSPRSTVPPRVSKYDAKFR